MEYVSVKIFIMNRYNYFKELHNEQEYYWPYTEQGQLWCQLLLVLKVFSFQKLSVQKMKMNWLPNIEINWWNRGARKIHEWDEKKPN